MNRRPSKSNQSPKSFRPLARADLLGFDTEAKNLILSAVGAGCVGRVSSKGHCILRNNTGGTAAVPRNMSTANRSAQNSRADVKRLLAAHKHASSLPGNAKVVTQQITVAQAFVEHGAPFSRWFDALPEGLPAQTSIDVSVDATGQPSFSIPDADDTALPAEQHLCPECDKPFASAAALGSHRRVHRRAERTVTTAQKVETPMAASTTTENAIAAAPVETDAAVETLQRVRQALGEDPRVAQLRKRVTELEEQLAQERAGNAELTARLSIIQEALRA